MARFVFIVLSAMLYYCFCEATTKDDDSGESSEGTTASPPICRDDEILDNCPVDCASNYCPKSRYEDQSQCPKPDDCPPPACKCRFNSKRAENGTCIVTRDCPPFECLGPNEEYDACPSYCRGGNCSQATPDGECHTIGKILVVVECKPACRCKKNFWRLNGTCVSFEQCPKSNNSTDMTTKKPQSTVESTSTCGDNEVVVECPEDCPSDYCPKSRFDNYLPCSESAQCGPPTCKCGFNSRRLNNGSCINTRDCPPFACDGPYEEYNPCPPYCPGEDCSQATPDGECHNLGVIGIVVECIPACRCQKNYWRDNGICVPYEKCPKQNNTEITTDRAVTTKPTKIIPVPKCGPSQTLVDCPVDCPLDYCPKKEDVDTDPCLKPKNCPPPACKCKVGTRRTVNGSCVPMENCPPFECTQPNEEYRACYPEFPGEDCSAAISEEARNSSNIFVSKCKPTCRCKENYWRLNGECVPFEKCNPQCPQNENYIECKNACSEEYCPKNEADTEPRFCKQQCLGPGCVCHFNYRRADNGTCIPTRNCPPFNCSARPNELYDPCPPNCPGESCKAASLDGKCPFRIGIVLQCNPKCRCRKGYWRDDSGICIPYKKCPGVCPSNEEYTDCAQKLCRPQSCSDIANGQRSFYCIPDVHEGCESGCVCKKGYLRSDNGTCVPEDSCNSSISSKCSGPYEEYRSCKQCPGDICSALTSKFKCPDKCCKSGCVCKKGYRRKSSDGPCVPQCDCPEMASTPAGQTNKY